MFTAVLQSKFGKRVIFADTLTKLDKLISKHPNEEILEIKVLKKA